MPNLGYLRYSHGLEEAPVAHQALTIPQSFSLIPPAMSISSEQQFPQSIFVIFLILLSVHVMLTAGDVHFFSLEPEAKPLPSCLNGTKSNVDKGSSSRYNAAIFPGKGNENIEMTHLRSPGACYGRGCEFKSVQA